MECYRSVARTFYRGSHAIVLVYSLAEKESFERLENWLRDVREECNEDAIVVVVGNKIDLVEEDANAREVDEDMMKEFVK